MMGRTVIANNSSTVKTENNGQVLKSHIMHNLVIGALHKRGVNIAEGYHTLNGQTGRKGYSMLLRNPYIKKSIRKPLTKTAEADDDFYFFVNEPHCLGFEEEKEWLRIGAYRHCVFDYHNIAEYYSQSDKDVQELIEDSAMVIIDYDKAVEQGYVKVRSVSSMIGA